ncbi:antibiotic biosynthesis monooxygenase [Deinococcus maricopensis]|uniref:Antibiotic biosynthesis monooxygenase n=1 Tax=Deinococcus maricopensis (strain DSM 21211 / LMG 22137 / NRRL B-23946 / LB-34) TaxID=709986 RepID=E8U6U9_DEIML|nr:antibiotic biosynthesis monooxygenase [Deinococcus maricopensis]ADV66788.1 Antibiotic biosynthesis monooxygenase [Deinococcus maricopensis DSM 21211]
MTESFSADQSVTLVISELVREGHIDAYERWARELHALQNQQPGFLGVNVIRPSDPAHPEYVTIVRFATYEALRTWQESPQYRERIQRLQDLIVGDVHYQNASGLQLWFDRPSRPAPAPAFWKQVLVGVVGVYPLIMLFSTLTSPVTSAWPGWLATLTTATLSTLFLTYPVLPLLTRWLRPWLYPTSR